MFGVLFWGDLRKEGIDVLDCMFIVYFIDF